MWDDSVYYGNNNTFLQLSCPLKHDWCVPQNDNVSLTVLDFPKRPAWSYEMSKEAVLSQEERAFKEYLQKIYEKHTPQELSYFDHNLEVRP